MHTERPRPEDVITTLRQADEALGKVAFGAACPACPRCGTAVCARSNYHETIVMRDRLIRATPSPFATQMLTSKKVLWTVTVMLLIQCAFPALWVIVGGPLGNVDHRGRVAGEVLTACCLFLAGLWAGGLSSPIRSYATASLSRSVARSALRQVMVVVLLLMGYLVLSGATPVLLSTVAGASSQDLVMARENIAKLNESKLAVRTLSFMRDVAAPVLFILSVTFWRVKVIRAPLALFLVVLSIVALVWTGQKSPLVVTLLGLIVWRAEFTREFFGQACQLGGLVTIGVMSTFLVTQPDLWRDMSLTGEPAERLWGGIVDRLFATPLEVTSTYVIAAAQGEIGWREVIPSYAFVWEPSPHTADSYIGGTYFSGGYESTLSGAICFGYPFVIGGLPACFLAGLVVGPALALSMAIVSSARNRTVCVLYSIYLVSFVIDGVHGNLFQYLLNNLFFACSIWVLVSISSSIGTMTKGTCGSYP